MRDRTRAESQMKAFKNCLLDCELEDLGFLDFFFTWCNNHKGEQKILEKIDIALTNSQWYNQFSNVSVVHGLLAYSNHCPLWVDIVGISHRKWGPKPFRFEMWVGEERCIEIIKQSWSLGGGGPDLEGIMQRIGNCSPQLGRWNKNCFGNVAKHKLEMIQNLDTGSISKEALDRAKKDIHI